MYNDIALLFFDHGTRRGWGISVTPRPLFIPGKDPVPTVQEAEWAPGPVWTGAEKLASTGIRSPDLPARSQSLCRLTYPAPWWSIGCENKYSFFLINLYRCPLDAVTCYVVFWGGCSSLLMLSSLSSSSSSSRIQGVQSLVHALRPRLSSSLSKDLRTILSKM